MEARTASGAGIEGLPSEKSKTLSTPISALRAFAYAEISRMEDFCAPYARLFSLMDMGGPL